MAPGPVLYPFLSAKCMQMVVVGGAGVSPKGAKEL